MMECAACVTGSHVGWTPLMGCIHAGAAGLVTELGRRQPQTVSQDLGQQELARSGAIGEGARRIDPHAKEGRSIVRQTRPAKAPWADHRKTAEPNEA